MCVWRGTWFGLVSKYIIYDKYGHEIRKIGKNTNKTQTDLAFKKKKKRWMHKKRNEFPFKSDILKRRN